MRFDGLRPTGGLQLLDFTYYVLLNLLRAQHLLEIFGARGIKRLLQLVGVSFFYLPIIGRRNVARHPCGVWLRSVPTLARPTNPPC